MRTSAHEVSRPDPGGGTDLERPVPWVFDAAARDAADAVFLSSASRPDESYTYGTFAAAARRIAASLVERGVAPGDRVAIWCENRPRWCVAYAAILYAGAAIVPVDAELSASRLPAILEAAGARVVFVGAGIEAASGALSAAVTVLGLDGPTPWSSSSAGDAVAELPRLSGGATVAAVLYTSGTTGSPKGVALTHRNLLAEIRGLEVAACVTGHEVVLMLLPLHHLLAQLGSFVLAAAFRARVVHVDPRDGGELLAAVREHGITLLLSVPLLLHLIHERITKRIASLRFVSRKVVNGLMRCNGAARRWLGVNLGRALFREVHRAFGASLRLIVSGGAPLDPRVQRDLFRLGFSVLQAYGLTETCGAATVTDADDSTVGSVGFPLAGVSVRIAEPDDDGIGEVLLRGPIVTPGYYGLPQETAALLRDGWLCTGDLGRLDAGGRLWITGRSKDVIVLGSGKNVHPEEVESHYARAPHIAEVCVISVRRDAGPDRTEKLHAVVVPDWPRLAEDGITSVRHQMRFELESLSLELPAWQRVLTFEIRREPLPRTATRKVRRFQVRAEARGPERDSSGPPPTPDDRCAVRRLESPAGAVVRRLIAERVGAERPVRAGSNLELDLGLDSLNRMELLLAVEQSFGVAIADADAERLLTVDDLLRMLETRAAAGDAESDVAGVSWPALIAAAHDDDLPRWLLRERNVLIRLGRWVLLGVLHVALRTYFRMRVDGCEHLPRRGAYLICPNHTSFLDGPAVFAAVPASIRRRVVLLGDADYTKSSWGRFMSRAFRVIPTDSNRALRSAMRSAAAVLRRGEVLIVFPEGGRSASGELTELKQGTAILAHELAMPIVPTVISGSFESWPRGSRWPRPGRVRVRFTERIEPAGAAGGEPAYERITELLAARLRSRPRDEA